MKTYQGSCHCGNVKFEIESDLKSALKCDCSLCRKKNAVMVGVHKTQFKLLAGEEFLSLYQWNMKIAKHYFCKVCGIYTFHTRRTKPDEYGVNFYCLDNADVTAEELEIVQVTGSKLSVADTEAN
ncbi:GFA family protein [Maritalea mediterranea]|uniref:GFA family protein n=1 Tax=Maritalea mediterranea TaxID=2909667 RepID=A0ABS9EA13_9HYPH|nr:GFA family protein [Maritalea mediterranea]MCF4098253.1 GFA family protein [Maritalea mediterranea]